MVQLIRGDHLIIYGRNVIDEALKSHIYISRAFFTDSKNLSNEMKELQKNIEKHDIVLEFVEDHQLDEITHSKDHQGVAAKIKDFVYSDAFKILDGLDHDPFIIVLDQIQDPQNFGAIIRSAYGAGVDLIILPDHGSVTVTPSVLKASAGYAFRMPVSIETNLARTIDELKKRNIWVYAATMDGTPYINMDFKGPLAFVFGNEGKGIRRLVLEKCDGKVSIPMARKMDSLNVSASAAIILFKAMEVRR